MLEFGFGVEHDMYEWVVFYSTQLQPYESQRAHTHSDTLVGKAEKKWEEVPEPGIVIGAGPFLVIRIRQGTLEVRSA